MQYQTTGRGKQEQQCVCGEVAVDTEELCARDGVLYICQGGAPGRQLSKTAVLKGGRE